MKKTNVIRKGNVLHFLKDDRKEVITETTKANNYIEGELKTDSNSYSVAFIRTWERMGMVEICKK